MMSAMSARLRVALLAVVAVALVTSACSSGGNIPVNGAGTGGSGGPHGSPAAVVTLHYVSFEPGTVTIHVGQTVEWKWEDAPIVHNVTFAAGFASPTEASGTWYHTFNQAGTFPYQCTIHIDMIGTVDVLP